jgi:hypothetical protein
MAYCQSAKDSIRVDTLYGVYMCLGRADHGYIERIKTEDKDIYIKKIYNLNRQLLAEGKCKKIKRYHFNIFYHWKHCYSSWIHEDEEYLGLWKYYYDTGELYRVGTYFNEQKLDDWIKFDKNGQVLTPTFYYYDEFTYWLDMDYEWRLYQIPIGFTYDSEQYKLVEW